MFLDTIAHTSVLDCLLLYSERLLDSVPEDISGQETPVSCVHSVHEQSNDCYRTPTATGWERQILSLHYATTRLLPPLLPRLAQKFCAASGYVSLCGADVAAV